MRILVCILLCHFGQGINSSAWESAISTEPLWHAFKTSTAKDYADPLTELRRRSLFEDNLKFVTQFNREKSAEAGFTVGLNAFSDLSNEEFRRSHLGFKRKVSSTVTTKHRPTKNRSSLPTELDWRKEGLVHPVRDQGWCGSCWAFSVAGAMEGQAAKDGKKKEILSPQNFVDCAATNHGCFGGDTIRAMLDMNDFGGVDSEQDYPYTATDGKCKATKKTDKVQVKEVVSVDVDEAMLQQALAEVGPISVALDASPEEFEFYKEGVFNSRDCSANHLNHAVLLVGYGVENGNEYWLVKNSWGSSWGENGYFKIARNKNNMCGIASYAVYPILK